MHSVTLPGVRSCVRPKMTNHRGRTWDFAKVTLPGGVIAQAWYDTTWGTRFYYEQDGIWYSAPIDYQVPGRYDFDLTGAIVMERI